MTDGTEFVELPLSIMHKILNNHGRTTYLASQFYWFDSSDVRYVTTAKEGLNKRENVLY